MHIESQLGHRTVDFDDFRSSRRRRMSVGWVLLATQRRTSWQAIFCATPLGTTAPIPARTHSSSEIAAIIRATILDASWIFRGAGPNSQTMSRNSDAEPNPLGTSTCSKLVINTITYIKRHERGVCGSFRGAGRLAGCSIGVDPVIEALLRARALVVVFEGEKRHVRRPLHLVATGSSVQSTAAGIPCEKICVYPRYITQHAFFSEK